MLWDKKGDVPAAAARPDSSSDLSTWGKDLAAAGPGEPPANLPLALA